MAESFNLGLLSAGPVTMSISEENETLSDSSDDNDQTEVPENNEQDSAEQEISDTKQHSTALSDLALLGEDIEILVNKRLPALDRGPSLAYRARSKGDSTDVFFALVCENHLVPRSDDAGKYVGILTHGLVKLVASGVVYWPPAKGQRYVFVYHNTLGDPIMKSLDQGGLGWSADKAMKNFIKPMVSILLDLRDADLVHGCINPTNIFTVGGDEERVIIGDCLSSPPAYLQPSVFEPIERAQCQPGIRGRGTTSDDLYAFGVSITMLLRNKDPLAGLDDEQVIRQKIELGSYAALTGKDRFTGAILELLRGLLYDDSDQRWTLEEIEAWLDGQSEAAQLVDGGLLEQWVERSLEDKRTKSRLEEAIVHAREKGRGAGYWERLVCWVSMALDPMGPVRFKGLATHPEGILYALPEAYMLKKDIVPYIDIINEQFVLHWISAQPEGKIDVGTLVNKFDSCRAFLRQPTIGYGIERCIYFLCTTCPCLSEKLDGYYVRNPEDLMHAYEEISSASKRPELFVDRHVAAFLSVRDRRMVDPYLNDLNASEYYKKILGNVKTLATIQKRSRMGKFPGIGSWVSEIIAPVLERYHDRDLRVSLKKKIEKAGKDGDLVRIVSILDDNDLKQTDFVKFRKAMKEYAELCDENEEIKYKMENPETFGTETGQDVAAIVSGFLSGLIILAFAIMHFTGGSVF
jgi:hypothetical protein